MRRILLLAGAAALAATMPAIAQDQGRGGGRGHDKAAHAGKQGGGQGRAERGRGAERQAARAEPKGRGQAVERARGQERQARADPPGRGRDGDRGRAQRAERQDERGRRAERAVGQERRAAEEARRGRPDRVDRVEERRLVGRGDRRDWRGWADRRLVVDDPFVDDLVRLRRVGSRGLAVGPEGCPPGLARQNFLCMPPGQFRKAALIGQRLPLAALPYNVPLRYRYRFPDDDRFFYRYGDASVYRFDRRSGLVSSVVPLVSTGLFPGEPLPLGYDVYNVPFAYRGYYPDSRDYLYRYDGNAIYRVNSDSMMVDGIVAMLTGGVGGLGGLGVGDPLPVGYDVYNVPYGYRDTYYDRNDAWYRYADGYVYQVDPQTRLIQEVISLLV